MGALRPLSISGTGHGPRQHSQRFLRKLATGQLAELCQIVAWLHSLVQNLPDGTLLSNAGPVSWVGRPAGVSGQNGSARERGAVFPVSIGRHPGCNHLRRGRKLLWNPANAQSTTLGYVYQLTESGSLGTKTPPLHRRCAGISIQGADGNFYGTTRVISSSQQGTVYKLTPTGQYTLSALRRAIRNRGPIGRWQRRVTVRRDRRR